MLIRLVLSWHVPSAILLVIGVKKIILNLVLLHLAGIWLLKVPVLISVLSQPAVIVGAPRLRIIFWLTPCQRIFDTLELTRVYCPTSE